MDSVLSQLFAVDRLLAPGMVAFGLLLTGMLWSGRRTGFRTSVHERVHAGGETDYYFDADLYLGDPRDIGEFAAWFRRMLDQVQHEFGNLDRLCFIEKAEGPVGALTLKDLLSWQANMPAVTVRLRGDTPSALLKVKGRPAAGVGGSRVLGTGERVLVVSDVATSGATILDAVRVIREVGGVVDVAVALFDREEGAGRNLREEDVHLKVYRTRGEIERSYRAKGQEPRLVSAVEG